MTEPPQRRSALAAALLSLGLSATACQSSEPDAAPSESEEATELGLSGEEACEVAGSQEILDFFAENEIEVRNQDLGSDGTHCSMATTWAVPEGAEEGYNGDLGFGLEEFESSEEAQHFIEHPGGHLETVDSRADGDLELEVPEPWESGFIWSRPDEAGMGPTDVAARIGNLVVYAQFEYVIPDEPKCEEEGCAVMPSELTQWLHDEYLPAVAEHVQNL